MIWTTEFGRTPFAQGSIGRDHNGGSFVTGSGGAGIKRAWLTDEATIGAISGREQDLVLRFACHRAPPAGDRSHQTLGPAEWDRPPIDRRAWARGA